MPIQAQQRVPPVNDDLDLLERLRGGDERTFAALVDRYHPTMLAVARAHVRTGASAEEVVQDAWVAVLKGLDRFEGRASLKTWVMRIVANIATTRGVREARSTPFSALAPEGEEVAVDADRFRGPQDSFPGHWKAYPSDWRSLPEQALLGRETLDALAAALHELPEAQRTVVTLRDVHGCSSEEVCATLEISSANQRVLLHRGRSRLRTALERQFDD
jgi:RNA polymerase sigma-70 factor (ECF subfamily)